MDSSGFRHLGGALVAFLFICCLIAFALGALAVWLIGLVL